MDPGGIAALCVIIFLVLTAFIGFLIERHRNRQLDRYRIASEWNFSSNRTPYVNHYQNNRNRNKQQQQQQQQSTAATTIIEPGPFTAADHSDNEFNIESSAPLSTTAAGSAASSAAVNNDNDFLSIPIVDPFNQIAVSMQQQNSSNNPNPTNPYILNSYQSQSNNSTKDESLTLPTVTDRLVDNNNNSNNNNKSKSSPSFAAFKEAIYSKLKSNNNNNNNSNNDYIPLIGTEESNHSLSLSQAQQQQHQQQQQQQQFYSHSESESTNTNTKSDNNNNPILTGYNSTIDTGTGTDNNRRLSMFDKEL